MHQLLRRGSFNPGQVDRHSHGNAESFNLSLQSAKGYRRINRYFFGYPDVTLSRNNPQGPDKAGCVANGKQLLWVGAIPFATHFNGTIQF
jgi:hypothetical protein